MSVFLSYARADDGEPYDPATSFAARLHADLTRAGLDVWFDRVSMPSRSLTFQQEIRDVIAARERLLLIVGPHAVMSEYVTQEWQFAYYAANKCLNPIVRRDGRDPHGARIDGYALIPEDLKLLHAEDFRDDSRYQQQLENLIRQLREPVRPAGKLVAVPELPPGYRAQPGRLKALRDLLLIDLQKPVVVTGAAARMGLQGMGGIGKSVLASALAHHPEVRRAFRHNIYWIRLGQTPHVEDLQRWLARQLGDEGLFTDRRTGKERLRELLAGRAALLILDDVWNREHAEAFNVAGPLGRILLTTRDAGLVTALAARENHYRVELPSEAEAEGILSAAAGVNAADLPLEARDIIGMCGRLPLALALCGGMVSGGISWTHVLVALHDHDLEFLAADYPGEEQHRNAWIAMDVSVRALPEEERDRFAELAVFPLVTGAPEAAVAALWGHTAGLDPRHTAKLLFTLAQRSLVQLVRADTGDSTVGVRMQLHDLLHGFADAMANGRDGSRTVRHRTLLDAYRSKCSNGWPSGPDDGYFLQELCGHLIAADQADAAIDLLTDLPWVEAKCRAGLVFDLQDDYRETLAALPEMETTLSEEESQVARLEQWTQDLVHYAAAWSGRRDRISAGQPVEEAEPTLPEAPPGCRMWSDEEIEVECRRIRERPTRADRLNAFASFVERECYLLARFGSRSGFVAQHAFKDAAGGPVREAASRRLAQMRTPLLLFRWPAGALWNPRPACLRTMEGHSEWVGAVSITSDGRRAVSASGDRTLRIWDLASGACSRTLEGHIAAVESLSMTPDGRVAVSASSDNTLGVWDLASATCLRTLEGHSGAVLSVGVTPDGRRAVSASRDRRLRVWDLASGTCLRTLEGHTGGVQSVSVTPDGRRAVSASLDETLRVWELTSGTCLGTLEGHSDAVLSVGVTADGRRAVSASSDKTVRVWDLASGTCLRTLEDLDEVLKLSITPDGHRAVSATGDWRLQMWNLASGTSWQTLEGHSRFVWSVSISPDRRRAVSGSLDKTVRVWDLASGICLRTLEGHSGAVSSVSVTPDGGHAVSGSSDKTLRVWDLTSGTCLGTLEGHTGGVRSVSMTADGRRAVSASSDKTLRVWDLASGACLRTLLGHSGAVSSVSLTPDWRRVVSASSDKTLRVWDLASGTCLRTLEGHSAGVQGVSLAPDGQRAVSASSDKTLRVWDLASGVCLQTLKGHSHWEVCASVTPDGRHVVSGSWDRTLRVWNLATGAEEAVLAMAARIHVLAGSHDILVTGTVSGDVHIIELKNLPAGLPITTTDANETPYEELLRQGLDVTRREKGHDHDEAFGHLQALIVQLETTGRTNEAHGLREERDRLAPLAATRRAREAEGAALRQREEAVDATFQRVGPSHPQLALALNNLAVFLRTIGRAAEAEPHFRRAIEIELQALSPDSPKHPHRLNNVCTVLVMQGKLAEARALCSEAWRLTAGRHDITTARILFVRLTIALLQTEPAALYVGQVKTLLTRPALDAAGSVERTWDVDSFIAALRHWLSTEHGEFVELLAAALNDLARVADLERFPAWRDQPLLSLAHAWPSA